jgi:hypothetical protein
VSIKKCMGCKEPWPVVADEPTEVSNSEEEEEEVLAEAMEVDSDSD